MSIAVGLLMMAAPYASAQSVPAGDAGRGPKSNADFGYFDENHDGKITHSRFIFDRTPFDAARKAAG